MLGLLARRVAARPVARGVRGVTHVQSTPTPLAFRMDSLMVGCMVAAVVHFVPQDAIILIAMVWNWHNTSAARAPKHIHPDADAAFEEWKAKKGLEKVTCTPGKTYKV